MMKYTFYIIFFLFTLVSSTHAQPPEAVRQIDSICNLINSKDTVAYRVKIKHRNVNTEWRRLYIDTIDNKMLKIWTKVENSNKGYFFYFIDRSLIRIDENTYTKGTVVYANKYYFKNGQLIHYSRVAPEKKTIQKLKARAKDLLDLAVSVGFMQRR